MVIKNTRFSDPQYVKWAKNIKERDEYTCQLCGVNGGKLNAHHLNSWDTFIEGRYDLDNGITLCDKCHSLYHQIYLKGNNTRHQFEEFKRMYLLIKEAADKEEKDGNA